MLRRLLIFAAVWYLLHELPPMKPYPEGARHMTVMAAVFAVFAAYAAEWLVERLPARSRSFALIAMIAAIAIVPAFFSYRLVQSAPDDTQLVVRRIGATLAEPVIWAKPATTEPSRELARPIEEIEQWPGFIVLNELFAEQYLEALTLRGQQRIMRERTKSYEALMKRPSLRVTSTAGSVALRNVPHRIVALGGDPAALAATAERFADEPDIKLDVVPGQTAAG